MSDKIVGADGCRLHYWFRGAPEDRIGGPWWYRVFRDKPGLSAATQRDRYLNTLKPFLHKAALSEASDPKPLPPNHLPPPGAVEVDCSSAWIDWSKVELSEGS